MPGSPNVLSSTTCAARCAHRWSHVLLWVCVVGLAGPVGAGQAIRVLTVGNSFAENATEFLPELARSRGVALTVRQANIGGSDLARHARHLQASLENTNDPDGRPYMEGSDPERTRHSLVEILGAGPWDFVTLNQFSGFSHRPETYEPHVGQLIAAIRLHAPTARIVVLQTWAYRSDHPLFLPAQRELQSAYERVVWERSRDTVHAPGTLTQRAMHEQLRSAYDQVAARYGVLLVPVGDAFQMARATSEWRFTHPDPDFDYVNPAPGSLPRQKGSLIGGWFWLADRQSGEMSLALDAKHANVAGKYLGACVFFEALTGVDVREAAWHPDRLSTAEAGSLREIAHAAVVARRDAETLTFTETAPDRREDILSDAATSRY